MPQLYNEDRTDGGDDDDTIKGLGSGEGGRRSSGQLSGALRSLNRDYLIKVGRKDGGKCRRVIRLYREMPKEQKSKNIESPNNISVDYAMFVYLHLLMASEYRCSASL